MLGESLRPPQKEEIRFRRKFEERRRANLWRLATSCSPTRTETLTLPLPAGRFRALRLFSVFSCLKIWEAGYCSRLYKGHWPLFGNGGSQGYEKISWIERCFSIVFWIQHVNKELRSLSGYICLCPCRSKNWGNDFVPSCIKLITSASFVPKILPRSLHDTGSSLQKLGQIPITLAWGRLQDVGITCPRDKPLGSRRKWTTSRGVSRQLCVRPRKTFGYFTLCAPASRKVRRKNKKWCVMDSCLFVGLHDLCGQCERNKMVAGLVALLSVAVASSVSAPQ